MVKKKLKKYTIYKKWYFWVILASVLVLVLVLALHTNGGTKVTICTERDYQGDMGPCTNTETVEIVAKPDRGTDCPVDTEPVYDVVGGIVGLEFVGCAKK